MTQRRFECYFYFVGWDCFSLGFHICTGCPNIELHIPFGFIRIGFQRTMELEIDQREIEGKVYRWDKLEQIFEK